MIIKPPLKKNHFKSYSCRLFWRKKVQSARMEFRSHCVELMLFFSFFFQICIPKYSFITQMMNGYSFKIFHCSSLKAIVVFKFWCDYNVKKWEANLGKKANYWLSLVMWLIYWYYGCDFDTVLVTWHEQRNSLFSNKLGQRWRGNAWRSGFQVANFSCFQCSWCQGHLDFPKDLVD